MLSSFSDTSRHYLPVKMVKKVIEAMSYSKLVRMIIPSTIILCIGTIVTGGY
jgi:Glycosyl hydrolase family 20, catalytic domain